MKSLNQKNLFKVIFIIIILIPLLFINGCAKESNRPIVKDDNAETTKETQTEQKDEENDSSTKELEKLRKETEQKIKEAQSEYKRLMEECFESDEYMNQCLHNLGLSVDIEQLDKEYERCLHDDFGKFLGCSDWDEMYDEEWLKDEDGVTIGLRKTVKSETIAEQTYETFLNILKSGYENQCTDMRRDFLDDFCENKLEEEFCKNNVGQSSYSYCNYVDREGNLLFTKPEYDTNNEKWVLLIPSDWYLNIEGLIIQGNFEEGMQYIRYLPEYKEAPKKDAGLDVDTDFSQYCQDYCGALYPSSAKDTEYTFCVLACVLG